jgi:Flp pilus assembly protein TadG
MRRSHARHGQSLVEFALVLPLLLAVGFAFTELLLVFKAQGTLASVATAAVQNAALAGGETTAVDTAIVSLLQQNGLPARLVRVQIATAGGAGTWHWADWHDLPAGTARAAWYPPPATYNSAVTVHLSDAYPLALPFSGSQTWTIPADASEASQMDPGVLPQ